MSEQFQNDGDLMKRLCQIAIIVVGSSLLTMAQSSTAKELIELENRFNEALVRADIGVIEEIEANDLIFTDATGAVTNKAEEIQNMKSGEVKFASIKMTDTHVQDYGNVGVVTGSLAEKAQYKNADISGTYRFTDVWAKRKGKWDVAGQETLVSTSAEVPATAASDAADVRARLATLINLQLQYKADAVGKLLDPDFVYVSNDGSVVMSRAEFIKLTDREKNPLDLLEVTDLQVRTSGDTAVATGIIHEKGLLYGKPYDFRGQTLITYARRNGLWLCLAIHD